MSTDGVKTITGMLAERFGLEPDQLDAALGKDPLTAALAISVLQPAQRESTDAAAIIRLVGTIVGACPLCLGEDAYCLECGGKGSAGWRDPDGPALLAWISRPLSRLGLCIGTPRRQGVGQNQEGRSEP